MISKSTYHPSRRPDRKNLLISIAYTTSELRLDIACGNQQQMEEWSKCIAKNISL